MKSKSFQRFLKHAPKQKVQDYYAARDRARELRKDPVKTIADQDARLELMYGKRIRE